MEDEDEAVFINEDDDGDEEEDAIDVEELLRSDDENDEKNERSGEELRREIKKKENGLRKEEEEEGEENDGGGGGGGGAGNGVVLVPKHKLEKAWKEASGLEQDVDIDALDVNAAANLGIFENVANGPRCVWAAALDESLAAAELKQDTAIGSGHRGNGASTINTHAIEKSRAQQARRRAEAASGPAPPSWQMPAEVLWALLA